MPSKPKGPVAAVLDHMHRDCQYTVEGIAAGLCRAPSQVREVIEALEKAGLVKRCHGISADGALYQKVPQPRKRVKFNQVDWVGLG